MSSDGPKSDSRSNSWMDRLGQIFGSEPQNKEQLMELLQDARKRALLDTEALNIIEGALQAAELHVRNIMVPRAQMIVVPRDAPLSEIFSIVIKSAHSRFPVIGDSRAEVVGMLLAKDLLSYCGDGGEDRFTIRDLLRTAVFIPESKRLNVLLKEFRSSRIHMAIVVDEYGSAAGLVTIEDVLEQIVGEISDEHNFDETAVIFKHGDVDYTVKAHTAIEDFNDYFGSKLAGREFDTIGGLVTHALGHLPKRGETIVIDGFRFKVIRSDSRRIHLLNVQYIPPGKGEDSGQHKP